MNQQSLNGDLITQADRKTTHSSTLPAKILHNLFPCQEAAIGMIERYLQNPIVDKSALVQMPMGTGKTGVMALCATQFPKYRRVLIVAPAEYLTHQIERAITKTFWIDARLQAPKHLRVAASRLLSWRQQSYQRLKHSFVQFRLFNSFTFKLR